MSIPVIALPGGVMPAAVRYAPLASQLDSDVALRFKDLEVYAGEQPPDGYSIDLEVQGLERFADSLGFDRFHLLAYSGGGFVSLACAGLHPDRLVSLAIFEPAFIPGTPTAEEERIFGRLRTALKGLSGPEFMRTFMQLQVKPGVTLPPPAGPPPPWMSTRPAGLTAMIAAFDSYAFDRERLRTCNFPVFLGYGDQTAEQEEVKAAVLARLFPDFHVQRFSGIHHFTPAGEIYQGDHVRALRDLWSRPAR